LEDLRMMRPYTITVEIEVSHPDDIGPVGLWGAVSDALLQSHTVQAVQWKDERETWEAQPAGAVIGVDPAKPGADRSEVWPVPGGAVADG
jgi:hypothetical protein